MVGSGMAADFERECFFIAPIGDAGTDIRKRSDAVRDWVVGPAAAEAHDLETVRADDVGEPGQITSQAIQHCLKAKATVADLTDGNPNVYYELSVRHGAQLPVVLIAQDGTSLPFDISQSRVIFFDHTDLASAGNAREELAKQIKASLAGPPDNPISDGMRLAELQGGNAEEQTLGLLMDRMQRLAAVTESIDGRLRRAERRATVKQNIWGLPRHGRDHPDPRKYLEDPEVREELDLETARLEELAELGAERAAEELQGRAAKQAPAQGITEEELLGTKDRPEPREQPRPSDADSDSSPPRRK